MSRSLRLSAVVVGLAVSVTLAGAAHARSTHATRASGPLRIATSTQAWGRRYTTPGADNGAATVYSPDGSKVFVTGTATPSEANGLDMLTVAYNASNGTQLWARDFNGPTSGRDYGAAIGISPDGTKLYVTGASQGSNGYDYETIAYDTATGNALWRGRFDSTSHGDDQGAALSVSPDGSSIYVTGTSVGSGTGLDIATVAYNTSTGATRWIRRFDGAAHGDDDGYGIAVSPDGTKVFVTGDSTAAGNLDYITLAYNASTGASVWSKRFNGPVSGDDTANAIGVSPDGTKVYVTGSVTNEKANIQLNLDFGTVAYDASTGSQLWSAIYSGENGDNDDQAYSLAVSPDGSKVFVTGPSSQAVDPSCSLLYDYATLAYNARPARSCGRGATTAGRVRTTSRSRLPSHPTARR